MAAEWTAQPLAELHLAVGRASAEGRCVAAAPVAAVEAWLDTVREAGFEAERLVPEPLLLEPPAEGMARLDRGAIALFRSRSEAFAAEPELAAMLLDGQAVVDVDPATFEDRLSPALAEAPVDLRQGPFGRRRELRVEGGRVRRLALLSAALLLASIGVELAAVARYSLAADRAEEETRRIAAAVLPGGSAAAENSGAIEDRLAELRGGGEGFTATAGALFEAVKATPNVELTALAFSPDGAIRATVASSSPPALDGVRQRLEAAGFAVETLAPRAGGGRRLVDIVARPR
jgi:general secretion pathway protein L